MVQTPLMGSNNEPDEEVTFETYYEGYERTFKKECKDGDEGDKNDLNYEETGSSRARLIQ